MNAILRSISFIFHPLFMPFFGVAFYFSKTPRYIPDSYIKAKLTALIILTIILPLLLFYLLKTLGKVKSIYLSNVNERIIPLILNSIILVFIVLRVLPSNEFLELYFFFIGILLSTLSCLILALLKFKASIHMMAISGIFMFFIALSIHFSKNINGTLALFAIICGAVATSRLHLKAHSNIELIIGFCLGFFPQLILINYWL